MEVAEMTIIKVNTKCKQYKKEDQMTKKSINMILEKLAYKIIAERKDINSIYNNDSIVYDRINDSIFIYKAHGANNIQLRIIYGFEMNNGDYILYLIDYVNKKKNDKQYIAEANNRFRATKISDLAYSEIVCFESAEKDV